MQKLATEFKCQCPVERTVERRWMIEGNEVEQQRKGRRAHLTEAMTAEIIDFIDQRRDNSIATSLWHVRLAAEVVFFKVPETGPG